MSASAAQGERVQRVADEVSWELLRDEWELLLAVGTGPTDDARVAAALEDTPERVGRRLDLLRRHGLVRRESGGWSLVPVVHQRQEGMASYLRELVLERIDVEGAPPLDLGVRGSLGGRAGAGALVRRADAELFPRIVSAASGPDSDRSERFLAVFAVSASVDGPHGEASASGEMPAFWRVLRAAALERACEETAGFAKMWVAEMRVDPEVASEVADAMEGFLRAMPARTGPGAATFGVWPVSGRAAGAAKER